MLLPASLIENYVSIIKIDFFKNKQNPFFTIIIWNLCPILDTMGKKPSNLAKKKNEIPFSATNICHFYRADASKNLPNIKKCPKLPWLSLK